MLTQTPRTISPVVLYSSLATAILLSSVYTTELGKVEAIHNGSPRPRASRPHESPPLSAARFFVMDTPMRFPRDEFDALVPFLDNIFTINHVRGQVAYFRCRLHRKVPHKSTVSEDKRQRARTSSKPQACPWRLKVTRDDSSVVYIRLGEGHNHDYAAVQIKTTSAARELVAQQVCKGYTAQDTLRVCGTPEISRLYERPGVTI